MFYTYIIYSDSIERYYIGYTSYTPSSRLDQHNEGRTPSTKHGIPWRLQFYKSFETKSEAIRFENFIKRQKSTAFNKRLIQGKENELKK